MREIEFKGKNLESGEWAYGDLLQNSDGVRFAIVPKNNGYNIFDDHLVDEDTIGQYIGVKDSCEDRIFEGDILLIYGGVGVIIWDTHSMRWGLESPGSCAVDFPMREDYERSKVIGNIYDNENIIK